ncbi:MAG: hypothetical protein ACRDY3_00845 [Acidimicrobiales bacterium]
MTARSEVLVALTVEDAAVLAPAVVAQAGDRSWSVEERAAWLVVGAQLLRQLRAAQ